MELLDTTGGFLGSLSMVSIRKMFSLACSQADNVRDPAGVVNHRIRRIPVPVLAEPIRSSADLEEGWIRNGFKYGPCRSQDLDHLASTSIDRTAQYGAGSETR